MRTDVGQKLKLARTYHRPRLTQEELANQMGIDRTLISKWENLKAEPSVETIAQIALKLGLPTDWFWDRKNSAPPSPLFQEVQQSVKEARTPYAVEEPIIFIHPDSHRQILGKYNADDLVALPLWQGVLAADDDGECYYVEEEAPYMVPPFFLGDAPLNDCWLIRASGRSASPRIEHSELAIVRRNSNPSINTIVVATNPAGKHFVKALRQGKGPSPYALAPLNSSGDFKDITDVRGWIFRGNVITILKDSQPGNPNIEWDFGRPLRA